jgi:hypothetical protein
LRERRESDDVWEMARGELGTGVHAAERGEVEEEAGTAMEAELVATLDEPAGKKEEGMSGAAVDAE